MTRSNVVRLGLLSLAAAAAFSLTAPAVLRAQSGQALPEGYIRPAPVQPGHAPKMKVHETSAVERVFEVRFSDGDEILSGLTELAEREHITAARITGIGGLSTALLGWGDPANGAFRKIVVDQKAELVSMIGDIQMRDGKPYVHVHAVVGLSDGSTRAGHMIEANVAPIAEISVVATAVATEN
jgi:predicted DNA-binding protein with PD1-like motif